MAKEFSKDNYINIPGFAITDLKLSGNELIVFSIIHGFSQDGQSEFNGSLSYLASALNSSRQTVINVLKSLTEKQLITKKETTINNIKFNSYSYNLTGSQKFIPPVKNIEKVVKKFDGGSQNFVPNNIYNNIINNKDNNSVYAQNKNFATPENQLDLEIEAQKIENEQNSLNNQEEEERKKVAPKKESRFSKPSIEEIKDYFFEIGSENYNLESEKFFDYYESNGWQVGKSKMKDWKATARNWNRNSKKYNNEKQFNNNTSTANGNAYEWQPNKQEQLESAAEHLRKINSF